MMKRKGKRDWMGFHHSLTSRELPPQETEGTEDFSFRIIRHESSVTLVEKHVGSAPRAILSDIAWYCRDTALDYSTAVKWEVRVQAEHDCIIAE